MRHTNQATAPTIGDRWVTWLIDRCSKFAFAVGASSGGGLGSWLAGLANEGVDDTGGRGGITQGVSFEFFESFLLIYSHNTHWVNFEFF